MIQTEVKTLTLSDLADLSILDEHGAVLCVEDVVLGGLEVVAAAKADALGDHQREDLLACRTRIGGRVGVEGEEDGSSRRRRREAWVRQDGFQRGSEASVRTRPELLGLEDGRRGDGVLMLGAQRADPHHDVHHHVTLDEGVAAGQTRGAQERVLTDQRMVRMRIGGLKGLPALSRFARVESFSHMVSLRGLNERKACDVNSGVVGDRVYVPARCP